MDTERKPARIVMSRDAFNPERAYVISIYRASKGYRVVSHFGLWETYLDGIMRLQHHTYRDNASLDEACRCVVYVVSRVCRRGYAIQKDHSWAPQRLSKPLGASYLPADPLPKVAPKPKPEPGEPITHVRFLEF